MNSSPDNNLQSLCQSCGLCCDGTLFYHTPIEKAAPKGCCDSKTDEEPIMPQPCKYYDKHGSCGIYSTRPKVCLDFECDLLAALEANKTTLSESKSIILRLKALREKLLATLDKSSIGTQSLPLFIRLQRFHSGKEQFGGEHVREYADFYMDFIAFSHLIRKHILDDFLKEDDDHS